MRRGDEVTVTETNIRPWTGTVLTVKPSRKSGDWVEVQREDGGVWVVPAGKVTPR